MADLRVVAGKIVENPPRPQIKRHSDNHNAAIIPRSGVPRGGVSRGGVSRGGAIIFFEMAEESGLAAALRERFDEARGFKVTAAGEDVALEIPADELKATMLILRDEFAFSQLIDLCGVDYADYGGESRRFAAVYQLLSVARNRRLRARAFCADDEWPALDSVCAVWPAANWYEREAFDLFGVAFHGHDDLRRLLTDYGFIGHPFRKDFPLSGQVEMRYDPVRRRVIYQPVTIAPREVTPRIVREEEYARERAREEKADG